MLPNISGETNISVYVVSHQRAAGIYHQIEENILHKASCFTLSYSTKSSGSGAAVRTVFIKTLSADYLGVNGLFTNILTILSFAELGIGNAIVFHMYKPLAMDDTEKLKSLMLLYKKAYRMIGMIVGVLGICAIPFMDIVISNPPNISENLIVIYLLFLFDTTSSYFFTYKKSIIIADQQNYIVEIYTQVVKICQICLQILILFATKNYLLFLGIQILSTFTSNIIVAAKADRLYPFLKEEATELPKAEVKAIRQDVGALIVYKFGSIILNGTDNIIISAIIDVTTVGIVSNYHLLINACQSILGRVCNAFTASVGNMNAVDNEEKQYNIFRKIFLINSWFYGFFSVCLMLLLNDFVALWIGKAYLLTPLCVFSLVLHFYVFGVHNVASTYRTTLGFFKKGKKAPLAAAGMNIILSILLGKWIGTAGIFFATSISRFFTMGIVDPYMIFKHMQKPVRNYYAEYLLHVLLYVGIYLIIKVLYAWLNLPGGVLYFLIKAVIAAIVFHSIFIIAFRKSKMMGELLCILRRRLKVF